MNYKGETKAMNIKEEALEADTRIRPYIRETPVEYSRYLMDRLVESNLAQ